MDWTLKMPIHTKVSIRLVPIIRQEWVQQQQVNFTWKVLKSYICWTAFAVLPPNNESVLEEAVALVGPISVCINANSNFMGYSSGVFDDVTCTSGFDDIDHCVLAVGYGTDAMSGKDYWLVKNSWGTTWGDQGYIKMARNNMNQCAISTLASYPDVNPTN